MGGHWIRKSSKGGATVVFVHGILSSGESCWKHPNGTYWPELINNEPGLESLGIYVYTYHTGLDSGSYSLSNVVDELKEHLITLDNVLNSKKIIFICHSMGGVVVRKFLVERVQDLLDRNTEVGLYLVASPSLGSNYANWLEPIAKFAGHAQAKALRFSQDNQWLNDLDKTFQNLKESHRLTIQGKELLEDKFITLKSFFRKQVVEPLSGARYFGESFKVAGSDHFSIAKPQNKEAIQHRLLLAFLQKLQFVDSQQMQNIEEDNSINEPESPKNNGKVQRIFISYRHVKPDEDLAMAFESELTRDGFQVFVDRKMMIGTEWTKEIDNQLKMADFFLVLLSTESIRSDMVRQEIMLAHELKKQGKLRILPVRVEFTGALPYDLGGYLNSLQYALWEKHQPMDEIAQIIRNAIRDAMALPLPGLAEEAEDSPEQILALHDVTEKTGAPLPEIDPRVLALAMERGSMACDSPFYISRQADIEMEQQLNQKSFTMIVKGARQMGKSSLLVRAAAKAKAQGYRVCYIDFQRLDETQLVSLNSLLLYFMHRIARELKTSRTPEDFRNEFLGAKDNATDFIEDAVLSDNQERVVLLLDEADRIFNYDYRNDFFALLRFWTSRRAYSDRWERFNLMIAHSTDPVLWIDDINQSPFNVGYSISLHNFELEQIAQLATRYQLSLSTVELENIHKLIGGHPFLARQSLYLLATNKITSQQLEDQGIRQDGPYGDHLRRLSGILSQREPLRKALLQILKDNACQDEQSFQRLCTAGLVIGASRHDAHLGCLLYEKYFRNNL